MKISTRFVFGLVSSLLLSAGLAKAATRFDPLSQPDVAAIDHSAQTLPTPDCAFPCQLAISD